MCVALAARCPNHGLAQQISYTSFDTPQAAPTSPFSNNCPTGTNILLCANYVGAGVNFIQDFYPPVIDPNAASDGGAGSTNYALQLTQNAGSQNSSMWFAVPQDVVDGFTTWYAVKLNFQETAQNYFTADGLAFVIQNAAGGKTDTLANCPATGSGPTVLGGGGGCLGYGGIDNSVALEMDTFWDSWDPEQSSQGYAYDDNHLALQSCGLDGNGNPLPNSPTHTSSPNCLLSLGGTSTLITSAASSAAAGADSVPVYIADGNPHQVVMIYNGPNESPANYLWVYLDATYNPGTHTPVAGSEPLFSGPFDITKYMKLSSSGGAPYSPAYVGFTAATGGDWEQHELMGWTFTPHANQPNFGAVNVCPAGQTTPAPCSLTYSFTYKFPSGATLAPTPQVVTQGVSGLDFKLNSSATTCSGTVSPGSCTVSVTFAPLAPGLRTGAVNLFDNSGNLLVSTLIYGTGHGPAVAFTPSQQGTLNTGSYSFNQPKGLATDAAGNLYVADTGVHNDGSRNVVKIAPNGTQTNLGSGLLFPQGIAVDGAGDLFVADNDLNELVKVPTGCTSSSCQQVLATPQCVIGVSGLCAELGVAVDGPGNVFIASFNSEVLEVPANGSAQTVVYGPAGSHPLGMAVDAASDLFIADYGLQRIVEIPPGCASASCQTLVGSGWNAPNDVAVDAAGDVFVSDAGLQEVVEVPAGCTVANCQIVLASGIVSAAVAVDASGDVFATNLSTNQIVEINRSQPPSVGFAPANVGTTSSPIPFTFQNIGNQTLKATLGVTGPNFVQVPGSGTPADCSASFALASGSLCNVSISFGPQISGNPLTSAAVFSDDALNAVAAAQTIALSGVGLAPVVPTSVAVPNVVGQAQTSATEPITATGLTVGTVTTTSSSTVPSGSVISESPSAGTQVAVGTAVNLLVSTGPAHQPSSANPLSLNNNYFLTGDYVSAGVTLRGTGINGIATGSITIPSYNASPTQGVPDGADIIDAFLYWETLENTPSASSNTGTFNGYSVVGQQIGNDISNYVDGQFTGTIRAYRADVNLYLPDGANGIRFATGTYTVGLPDSGGSALPLTEGASLVLIYRVLSPNFPLKSVVIYDGSAAPTVAGTQVVQGFYDAVGGAAGTGKNTNLFAFGGAWNNSVNNAATLGRSDQFSAPLNPGAAYAAVILSTPVNNSDNDGILDAWKTGPPAGDFHAGQPGYYDTKTGTWVGLPGAAHGQKDLFVQLDYMCGNVLTSGACDPTQENLFPSPDADGNDPLAMVQQAFANSGVQLHLQVGNAVPETTCTDSATTGLCQFPNQPGVIGWKNSLEFSKLWPRNFLACITGGDCTTRFPYGQKDSYHYLLMGHSLAIPAWNTRYGTLTSINVMNGVTTIVTADRGPGINACPSRITLDGVLGNPALNGVYNTSGCADTKTITVPTPGVPNWSYPNNKLPEPVIGLTSGTITSISGYSDLGGADSAVTLGLWLTAPNQDMSKRANVLAGTIFHEIGHTLGLSHGGLYYDTSSSYVPTFDANCKPNYQSVMNYLFQLDLVGPAHTVAYSNQTLATLNEDTAGSVTQLVDTADNAATFPTSAWYVPYTANAAVSPATLHCDGTPLNGELGYRVDAPIAPITPPWSNGQDLNFIGTLQTAERGYNDLASLDLRQVGATGGEFASLASVLSFGSSSSPLNIASGGTVTLGSGGTVALGSGGTVTLGSGGNVTLGSGGTITLGSGGTVTLGSGGNVTLGSGGTVTPGSSGLVTLGSGGTVNLGSGGTITLGSGGTVTLGSGGTVTLGSGGTIALGSGGSVTIPSTGGSYTIDGSGGTVTLGSGGTVALGSGGTVTLGSGGTIALGSGGTVTLGSGGNVTLGSGGTIALGSGGTVALGSGGNVTLGSGGTITLGSGGTITLGSGGTVTLGSGGTVTLGSGGTVALGSGGNVTLGSGGAATLGAGGTVTLGSGGTVTLGSGGTVTLGSGGTITLGSGGTVALGSGGTVTLGSGGTVTLGSGGTITLGSGGTVTLGSGGTVTLGSGGAPTMVGAGGTVTLGSGGTVTLGSGGNVTLGSGGNVTLGSGGTITLGSGGNVTLGSGGTVTLGSGGTITLGSGGTVTLGSGGNVTLGSGGVVTLGSGGTVTLGSGGTIALGSGGNVTLGSGGTLANELTYETANAIVRAPSLPTETPTPIGVRVDWTAPAFGVVQTYTIYRSSNGDTPVAIGSVSGVNGFPPATEFTDTNPDLTSQNVVYTISTVLVPDATGGTSRQSPPSPPAVLKNDQTIALGPLPSSVTLANPPTVTATALSGGLPNGLQVAFSATGSCAIGSQTIANNVSSATVALSGTGSCTVTASQPGGTAFNAANSVSGTFTVLSQGSSMQSQTISFATLPSVTYGGSFSPSATASSGLPVSFTASGPCTASGGINGVGVCNITASAAATSTYSAASLTQSFTIYPAVLKVTATNLSSVYGQPIPALTYSYSGFVNHESASVVSGAPALSTTATATSNAGTYPITVSTGTVAAANYDFLYVNGVLTVQQASQTIMLTTNPPASATYGSSFTVAARGGASGSVVTFTSAGSCSNLGATYKMTSGTGTCSVIASEAGSANYAAASPLTKAVTAAPAAPVLAWPAPAAVIAGNPLTTTQLDATASFGGVPLPGTFVYTPKLGTVLGVGASQTLSVAFTPNDSVDYTTGIATVPITVNPGTVSLGISNGTQTYQQWTNLIIGPIYTGSRVPTGSVTLYDNGAPLATLTLGGNAKAYYTANPFNVGANILTATYSGDSYFPAGISSPVNITVVPAPVNFQASCWGGQVYGSTYQCTVNLSASTTTVPGGSITYSFDGGAAVSVPIVNGNAPFTLPVIPAAGGHKLVLNYPAQGNFAAAGPFTESFTTAQGQTQLQATPSSYYLASGSSLTISGTATTPTSGTPPGSVTVYDNNVAIGTATIGNTGAISYKVTSIAKGSHSYRIGFAGSASYAAANSGTAAVTVY